MSANVESMFYAGREKPWHGLGTQVEEAPTSADALRLAGLDWTVQRKPIQVCGGRKVDNFFANVRSSDGAVLGVVSDRYQVVQNAEAFAFTDALIGGEGQVHYETAGSLMGGRKIWLLAKLPDTEIVGDKTVLLQHPRRQRRYPRVYDTYPGGLQQHSEHRTERRKACVVCPAYRRHSGQAPGGADVSGHGE